MRLISIATTTILCTALAGCVSQSSLVETNRIAQPRTDMTEAARTRMSLGLNYLQRGDMPQAKFNLEKASELAPDLAEIDSAIAFYYQQVGEYALAERSYRLSLRKDSKNPDTLNNFGVFLCQQKKYAEAETLIRQAIQNPSYLRVADSYENLAFCAVAQQDYAAYHQFLRQSLQHNANRVSAIYLMAELSYAKGDLTEAKRWSDRLQQLDERSAPAKMLHYLLARLTGDVAAMQQAERFILQVHPLSQEALMLQHNELDKSRPEQLRQAYQQHMLQSDSATSNKSKTEQPKTAPQIKVVKRKAAESAPTTKQYQVQDGDSLATIAQRFNLDIAHLLQWNQLKANTVLEVGQIILLRDPALSPL